MTVNRRQMLLASGAALLGAGATANRALGREDGPAKKKVLFFTKSSGFEHSVIARKDGKPALAERILTDLGQSHNIEVVASKDGRLFDPDKIGQWDAFAFETTGDLTKEGTDKQPPISADGLKAFFDAIQAGKGFVGMHCASDTFGDHRGQGGDDPYIKMIGGHFSGHGSQQKTRIVVVDDKFPGVAKFGEKQFELEDEWYSQKYLADDLHVILAHDTEDLKGHLYWRPNFPETWAHLYGKGRVFYTSMGHREDVWENPKYQGLLLGALSWALGRVDVDITPNVGKVTPGYNKTGA